MRSTTASAARSTQAVAPIRQLTQPGQLYTQIKEPYFFSYVRDQLIAKYGVQTVQSGGLRVYTTIDPAFQRPRRRRSPRRCT